MIIKHHSLSKFIVSNPGSLFIFKFWSLLYNLLGIKAQLSLTFYPQTNSQTKRQNSIMNIYLPTFINWKQKNWARLLPIAKFVDNNSKNANIGYMFFELYCNYYLCVFFQDEVDLHSKSQSTNKQIKQLRQLISICQQNLLHAQKLYKKAYNKMVKLRSYTPGKKVQLNNKYIKKKQNEKYKAKFFKPFQAFDLINHQVYKLKLRTSWEFMILFTYHCQKKT